MDRLKSETTENLLSKIDKMEEISEAVLAASQERLNTPIKKIEYGESGVIDIESGRWEMHAEYSSPAEKVTWHFGVNKGSEDRQKKVEKLVVTLNDKEIDVLKLLPSDTEIFIIPEEEHIGGLVHKGQKIFIWGDLAKPHTLVILAHEIGHIIDIERLTNAGLLGTFTSLDEHEYSEEAAVLRRERVATAFAFRILRPILNSDQRRDVFNMLKYYALKSYYDNARRAIEAKEEGKAYERKFLEHLRHDHEADEAWVRQQEELDEFEEWKRSEGYREWKLRDENKALENQDEFQKWREKTDK